MSILVDAQAKQYQPPAYCHHHNLHLKDNGITTQGQAKGRVLNKKLRLMIIGQPIQPGTRQIFRIPPHLTFDNHYSGDGLQQYARETIKNISLLSTCARNKTPKDIPPEYLHIDKPDHTNWAKVTRFLEPIVITKTYPPRNDKAGYKRIHVSMQSTSSTNFSMVNAINACSSQPHKKSRGQGENKRE